MIGLARLLQSLDSFVEIQLANNSGHQNSLSPQQLGTDPKSGLENIRNTESESRKHQSHSGKKYARRTDVAGPSPGKVMGSLPSCSTVVSPPEDHKPED
jgi:hypothetical protein